MSAKKVIMKNKKTFTIENNTFYPADSLYVWIYTDKKEEDVRLFKEANIGDEKGENQDNQGWSVSVKYNQLVANKDKGNYIPKGGFLTFTATTQDKGEITLDQMKYQWACKNKEDWLLEDESHWATKSLVGEEKASWETHGF